LLFTAYCSKICSANCSIAFRDFVATFRIPPKTASNGLVIPIFVSSNRYEPRFLPRSETLRGGQPREQLSHVFFEPKIITNKVRDDAVHLLVGFEHQPRTAGRWEFTRWDLVDLAQFKVRLKAQFQGSHRDIDKPDAIVSSSAKQRPEVAPPSDGRNISGP
jgi:hypothetical protein